MNTIIRTLQVFFLKSMAEIGPTGSFVFLTVVFATGTGSGALRFSWVFLALCGFAVRLMEHLSDRLWTPTL